MATMRSRRSGRASSRSGFPRHKNPRKSKLCIRPTISRALLVDTGMRLAELANPRVLDVDEREQRIRVVGKGDKERPVYLSDWTNAVLSTYVCFNRPGGLAPG